MVTAVARHGATVAAGAPSDRARTGTVARLGRGQTVARRDLGRRPSALRATARPWRGVGRPRPRDPGRAGRRRCVDAPRQAIAGRARRSPSGSPGGSTFGTAGLRARMGPGRCAMNRVVVRQAAAGLAGWLGPGRTVVIGYDARHKSDEFARGRRPGCWPRPAIAPLRASTHAVRRRCSPSPSATSAPTPGSCAPPATTRPGDNGYKVYLGDGAQIIPPVDDEIAAAIDAAAGRTDRAAPPPTTPPSTRLGAEVDRGLPRPRRGPCVGPRRPAPTLRIVYTPMHGVGGAVTARGLPARRLRRRRTWSPSQAEPDPRLPDGGVPQPRGARRPRPGRGAGRAEWAPTWCSANDPDADRLGVMVRRPDGIGALACALTGNEIGAAAGRPRADARPTGDDRLVVDHVRVVAACSARLAAADGVHHAEVPTGFKWVVRPGPRPPRPALRVRLRGGARLLGRRRTCATRTASAPRSCLARSGRRLRADGAHGRRPPRGAGRAPSAQHVTGHVSWRADGVDGAARLAAAMAGAAARRRPARSAGRRRRRRRPGSAADAPSRRRRRRRSSWPTGRALRCARAAPSRS